MVKWYVIHVLIFVTFITVRPNNLFSEVENPSFQIGANIKTDTLQFAVSEFQNLAKQISNRSSRILQEPFLDKFVTKDIVLISGEKPFGLTRTLTEAGVGHLDKSPVNTDGFLIETVKYQNHNILIIAARSDIGALYGVYEYFERYCEAGYFYDGDYLPSKPLVFSDVFYVFEPKFIYRGTSCWTGHRGLNRNFPNSWDKRHWERYLKWMAKKKLNFLAGYELAQEHNGGDINVLAFPEIYTPLAPGPPAGSDINDPTMGWIQNWHKELTAQRKLTQQVFKFGRELGIKFANTYDYGRVYPAFVRKHPQYKYTSSLLKPGQDYYHMGKTWDALLPGTSECKKYTHKLWKTIYDVFGTDSMWRIAWFTELHTIPGKSVVDLKIQAAQEQADIIKQIDIDGNILIDMWGMDVWSKEELDRFWAALPKNVGVIIFNNGPLNEKLGDLGGHKWIMNYLVAYAGNLHLQGNPDVPIKHIKQYIKDPKTMEGLLGFTHGSETLVNPFYTQLAAALAWDPEGFEKEEFVRHYARHRFGAFSFENMYKSVKALSEGMLLCGLSDNADGRRILQRLHTYITTDTDKKGDYYTQLRKADEMWSKALYYALKEAENQTKNKLYHDYMMELTLQFLESKLSFELIPLAKSYKKYFVTKEPREKETLRAKINKHMENIHKLYNHIIALVATDPDYCLKNDIDRLLTQKGTNPFTTKEYQRWTVNSYCSSQAVECYRDYYYPLFNLGIAEMKQSLETDILPTKMFDSTDFNEKKKRLWIGFFDTPLRPISEEQKNISSIVLIKNIFTLYSKVK